MSDHGERQLRGGADHLAAALLRYEVEQKYRVADLESFEQRLTTLQAVAGPPEEQVDTYFSHPQRDFATTDEALRIRRIGDRNLITYKGPKLDATTKTRREMELELEPGQPAGERWRGLLTALGFRGVADVRKLRRTAPIFWEETALEITLDIVDNVGTFVEIETLASESELDSARRRIQAVAESLGLEQPERRSYLELLLAGAQDPASRD